MKLSWKKIRNHDAYELQIMNGRKIVAKVGEVYASGIGYFWNCRGSAGFGIGRMISAEPLPTATEAKLEVFKWVSGCLDKAKGVPDASIVAEDA